MRSAAARRLGSVMQGTIERLRQYLVTRHGAEPDEQEAIAAIFLPYVTSVLLPTFGDKASLRDSRELITLGTALDALIRGDFDTCGDILCGRFKAVETKMGDGHWNVARHHELIAESRVSAVSQKERERAIRQENQDLKYRTMAKKDG